MMHFFYYYYSKSPKLGDDGSEKGGHLRSTLKYEYRLAAQGKPFLVLDKCSPHTCFGPLVLGREQATEEVIGPQIG